MLEFYKQSAPKAKKEHECEMCGETIHVGEVYSCETGKYDGEIFTRNMHLDCHDAFDELLSLVGESEFDWEGLIDWWKEYKCSICQLRYNVCNNKGCDCDPKTCDAITDSGCCANDECEAMDKWHWCTMFEKVKTKEGENQCRT